MPRIYLDNAATSYPKPEAVYAAVDRYQRELGTAVGRGSTRASGDVQRIVDQGRLQAARMFGATGPQQVIFTLNGTDSLNLAIQGLLREGDRAITTVWDHNSVLRPLRELETSRGIETQIIPADKSGGVDLELLEQALKVSTRLVVVTHASNVTGIVQPVREIARLAHSAGALVLLDAAQTAGHLPVNLGEFDVDLIACPGHKGLLGPLGTGMLVLADGVHSQLQPLRFGGTGTTSESSRQPETLPEKFESGNLNAPGLVGLAAALEWRKSHSTQEHETGLVRLLIEGLEQLPHVQVHLGEKERPRVGVVSFSIDRMLPQVVSTLLDQHFQIESRAGLHCAPLAHETLGTLEQGGTVRLSPGRFTTEAEIDLALEALAQIVAAL
ncbi:aminotransferase class V-fold PLP-dependent enzyme [Planctomicrobium sp. SH661]|uniref:aminotransferase class V-fold PLP-dependent enzyme n=1 Tax=Planctomicrobium sp. SH661 TaxID=3448124 RepID=UPI003F5B66F1